MQRVLFWAVILVVLMGGTTHAATHGELTASSTGTQAWDATRQAWVGVDTFWERFAQSQGGLTWGRSRTYPAYDQVKERDLFLVELDQGTCLMEFFHQRWRRANDVRRWDPEMNTYGGCPHVFD